MTTSIGGVFPKPPLTYLSINNSLLPFMNLNKVKRNTVRKRLLILIGLISTPKVLSCKHFKSDTAFQ
jgi:hypothetical protein